MAEGEERLRLIREFCEERIRQLRRQEERDIAAQYLDRITQGVYDRLENERGNLTPAELNKRLMHYTEEEIDYAIDVDGKTLPREGEIFSSIDSLLDDVLDDDERPRAPPPAVREEGTAGAIGNRYSSLRSIRTRFVLLYLRRRFQLEARPPVTFPGRELLEDLMILRDACDIATEPEIAWRLEQETQRYRQDKELRAFPVTWSALDALYHRVIDELPGEKAADADMAFLYEIGIGPYDPRPTTTTVKVEDVWDTRRSREKKPRGR